MKHCSWTKFTVFSAHSVLLLIILRPFLGCSLDKKGLFSMKCPGLYPVYVREHVLCVIAYRKCRLNWFVCLSPIWNPLIPVLQKEMTAKCRLFNRVPVAHSDFVRKNGKDTLYSIANMYRYVKPAEKKQWRTKSSRFFLLQISNHINILVLYCTVVNTASSHYFTR